MTKSSFMTELDGIVRLEGKKIGRVHVKDQELMRLVRQHCGDCPYSNSNIGKGAI